MLKLVLINEKKKSKQQTAKKMALTLGRVSALPWELIKESESSYRAQKEENKNIIKEINVLEDFKR